MSGCAENNFLRLANCARHIKLLDLCLLGNYYDVGRYEFTSFLPANTQGVIIRPLGNQGVMIVATDTQRGFGRLDQVILLHCRFIGHNARLAR